MSRKLNYLHFNEAMRKTLEMVKPITFTEIVPISHALGRIVSKDIKCVKNLPSFNNSAMDGFAVKFEDIGKKLKINKKIFAGDKNLDSSLKENECYKIMTGAIVPDDVDTVIQIEKCLNVNNDTVEIPSGIKKGANIRLKGEEKSIDEVIIKKGEKITAPIVAILASQGLVMVEVYVKLSIAVLSTGNEIIEPWEHANEEEIYNCNSFSLISQLKEKGFEATYCGVIPDNLEESCNFIETLKGYDVIITSGGISAGDADFTEQAFVNNGLEVEFHGVNIKPGKPIMMGIMGKTTVICLPGNPLTSMVNMYVLVMPMLNKLQGSQEYYHEIEIAKNLQKFKTKPGRVNIILGKNCNGEFKVAMENKYGSGMITVLGESNCVLLTSEVISSVDEGIMVKVINFNEEMNNNKVEILN